VPEGCPGAPLVVGRWKASKYGAPFSVPASWLPIADQKPVRGRSSA
jgi:hypothetical protein